MRLVVILLAVVTTLSSCALPSDTPSERGSQSSPGPNQAPVYATTAQVLQAVSAAQRMKEVPPAIAANLAKNDQIQLRDYFGCREVQNVADAELYGQCAYGDPNGKKLMAVYGDSQADMWAASLEGVAKTKGWKLVVFAKHACPIPELDYRSQQTQTPDEKCTQFHATAPQAVMDRKPDLVILASFGDWQLADGSAPSVQQWQDGWTAALNKFAGTKLVVLGSVPLWKDNTSRCLAAHLDDVQACSTPVAETQNANLAAEKSAADAAGALYIPTAPWLCADQCEPIIADTRVFNDDTHFTQAYADYLTGAVGEAMAAVLG